MPLPHTRKPKVDESGLATTVLMALHRLIKQSTLYEDDNEAQRRQVDMTRKAVVEFGRKAGRNPKIYFTDNSVFIGSKLLRAGRAIYIAALELGETLKRFDINEVAIGYDVTNDELTKLQGHFRMALRNQGASPKRFRYKRVRLRSAAPPHLRTAQRNQGLAASELVVRNYCTAIVVMRRFLNGLQQGSVQLPPAVRRIAEQLADLSAVQSPVFLASTALYNSRHEHAGRAVNSALIAVAMAKQLSDDPRIVVRAALAALLYDAGIPKVAGTGPTGEGRVGAVLPTVGVDQESELPAAGGMVVSELTGLGNAGMVVTSLVYEALHLNHRANAGAAYCGVQPVSLEARIVATARRFTDLIADPNEERTADQAVSTIQAEAQDNASASVLRLLTTALGMFSTGNLLELNDGHVAQVIRTHENPKLFGWPVVRVVLDPHGGPIQDGMVLNLAEFQARGEESPVIRLVAMGANQDVSDGARASRTPRPGTPPPSDSYLQAGQVETDTGSGPFGSEDSWTDAKESQPYQNQADWSGALPRRQFSSYADGEGPISVDFLPLAETSSAPIEPKPSSNELSRRSMRLSPMMPPASNADGQREPTPQQPFAIASRKTADPVLSDVESDSQATLIAKSDDAAALLQQAEQKHVDRSPLLDAMHRAGAMAPVHDSGISTDSALDGAPTVMSTGTNVMDLVAEKMRALGHASPAGSGQTNSGQTNSGQPGAPGSMPDFDLGEDDLDSAFDDILEEEEEQATRHLVSSELAQWMPQEPEASLTDSLDSEEATAANTTPDETTRIFDANNLKPQLDAAAAMTNRSDAGTAPAEEVPEQASENTALEMPGNPSRSVQETASQTDSEWYQDVPPTVAVTAEGTLAETPLLHLLVYVLDQELSGTMLLQNEDEHHGIRFEAGSITKIRNTSLIHPLGQVLESMSLLDQATLRKATQDSLATGTLLGASLREAGAIDDNSLRSALQLQLRRKMATMLELDGGTSYRFFADYDLLTSYGGQEVVEVDPLSQVMVATRASTLSSLVAPLRQFAKAGVALHAHAPIHRLELNGQEQSVVAAIRAERITLAGLAQKGIASKDVIVQTLYGLMITRSLAVGGSSLPVGVNDVDAPKSSENGPASTGLGLSSSKSTPSPFRADGAESTVDTGPTSRVPTTQGVPPVPRKEASTGAVVRRSEPSSRDGLPRRGTSSSATVSAGLQGTGDGENTPNPAKVPPPPRSRRRPPSPPFKRRKPPAPKQRTPPPTRPAVSTDPRRNEIQTKAKQVAKENFFDVLGVEKTATTRDVQTAYFALAKRWHPDRLPDDLTDLRPTVAKIFSRVNEAYQTLTDQAKREQYTAALTRGGNAGERAAVERAVDSALLFQKGEVLFKKGQLGAAETLVQKAANQDPNQPEYQALLAWIQSERLGLPPAREEDKKTSHYRAQIGMLDSVLASEPEFARALFYRACLLKRSGYADMAIRDFKRCAELDPRNLDAVREVRIHQRRSKREDSAATSIFNRFFNKNSD